MTAHLSVLAIVFMGFGGLALAMERHAKQSFGRLPGTIARRALRWAGWLLLSLALALSMRTWGGTIGAVVWFAWLSVAGAVLVFLPLPWLARRRQPAATPRAGHGDVFDEAALLPHRRGARALWRALALAGLVVLPLVFSARLADAPLAPVLRDDAVRGTAGPWSFVIAEVDRLPPVPAALDHAMKTFEIRFCEACDAEIRSAYLRVRQPRSLRGAGIVFNGARWTRRVEIQIPPGTRSDDQLWLTVEGMDGSVHQVGLDIASLSPETARYIERLAAVPEGPARTGTASR